MNNSDVPLSGEDLDNAIKHFDERGVNIKTLNDVKEDTDIEQIFRGRGHVVFFHKYKKEKVGHWFATLRDRNNNIFFIDSFGMDPGYYNKNLINCFRNNGIKNVIVNKKSMQGENSNSCGRYSVLFCALNKLGLSIPKMYEFIENGKKNHGSYDDFVLELTA
ncbi:MAG: hypothetical protein ABWZ79_05895 [Pedobacter agri]